VARMYEDGNVQSDANALPIRYIYDSGDLIYWKY
jgi:hypothetical protein